TDTNVANLYLAPVLHTIEEAGWTPEALVLPPGEGTKSAAALALLHDWALGHGIERGHPILALGGGVIGDVTGFAAATLLRGVPLVQLPTTLVAQADAAIGGKTGINHPRGKNLIGAFHQPHFVLADPNALRTLPRREYLGGLAEVVKVALVADAAFFDWLDARWPAVLDAEPALLPEIVGRAAAVKAAIVSEDEHERGRRALLNFGHTFAHALEHATGYGPITHGEAVALGMRAALRLSAALRGGDPSASIPPDLSRADALIATLPTPSLPSELTPETLLSAMASDKKRMAGRLRFVVLDQIGRSRVANDIPEAWALDACRAILSTT
ncbi:MAG TPA: 3-dehydroquinate synthase, partial [Rubricoccaceae bacterium]|nr:3-dehydroquinate synthase [Rubricoccaceae bacterium]